MICYRVLPHAHAETFVAIHPSSAAAAVALLALAWLWVPLSAAGSVPRRPGGRSEARPRGADVDQVGEDEEAALPAPEAWCPEPAE